MDLRAKQRMFEKYKFLLNKRVEDIGQKHFVNADREQGLRCFHFRREKGGEKDKILRCVSAVIPGSVFCKEHDYDRSIINVKREVPKIYQNKLHTLFDAYLNEPTILDHKQDLAILRTLLTGLINKLTQPDKITVEGLLSNLEITLQSDGGDIDKYERIMDIFYRHQDVFSDKTVKNINDTVKNIGQCIERIQRAGSGDQFLMTPEGLNVFLRTVVGILKETLTDHKDLMLQVQTKLMTVSVATKGNLQVANDRMLEEKNNEDSGNNSSTNE